MVTRNLKKDKNLTEHLTLWNRYPGDSLKVFGKENYRNIEGGWKSNTLILKEVGKENYLNTLILKEIRKGIL